LDSQELDYREVRYPSQHSDRFSFSTGVQKMFCPKCSQQQASDQVRFCSRCGFQLARVAELIANDGVIPAPKEMRQTRELSPRDKGIRGGMQLIFLSIVLLPIFFGLSIPVDNPAPLIVPVTVFLAGLVLRIYAKMFSDEFVETTDVPRRDFDSSRNPSALPPQQSIPISDYIPPRTRTAEMIQPPSVVEGTTKLLDERDRA
jgi:hypothetical protein